MRKAFSILAVISAILALPLAAQAPKRTESATAPLPSAKAVPPTGTVVPGQVEGVGLNATDLNSWLDGFMPYAMARGDIPGAVVVVVKDGQVLAERGYGYANLAKQLKVDPKTSLFRPGSISKLFTWTAVMQQVEQGKLDLDADVNKYLDFKIPPYQGKPITLRNIMTHTAGFEEQVKDLITTKQESFVPYDKLLKRWVPKRVYSPGTTPAYSNYATSLAGYIVSRASREPFDQYIDRHIFAPLQMQHSTFRQPVPANLKPLLAEGYQSGVDKPYGYEFVGPAPAGSLSATGEDMGRFMIAHLQDGAGILKPETAKLMHSRANQPIPGLNGMALGFYEHDINGRRVIAHGGDTVAFHSDLHLFIDEGVGLFVSFNSAGKQGVAASLRQALFEEFADRYFPAPKTALPAVDAKAARADAEKLAGSWGSSRRGYSSFISIVDLIDQTKVGVGKDGELIAPVIEQLSVKPYKWVAAGPMLWRNANGHELLSAKMENGKPVQLSVSTVAPIIVLLPEPWYLDASWLLPLLYFSLGVLGLTAILWPLRWGIRRKLGTTLALERPDLKVYRWSRIAAVAIVGTLLAWFALVSVLFEDVSFGAAMDYLVWLLGTLSLIAFVGGLLVMVWYLYTVWRGKWRWPAKVWSIALVIAAATVLHVAINYHLIGWPTYY